MPCGTSNEGTYFTLKHNSVSSRVTHAWTAGVWQHFSITIQTNADGSVTLKVYDDDTNTLITQGTDTGGTNTGWTSGCTTQDHYPTAQYPPITAAGSVGVRGDFDNFNVDDFTVAAF